MSEIDELLNSEMEHVESESMVNDEIVVNPITRMMDVPISERLFGVVEDANVEKKYFRCPRYVGDDIDLSKLKIYMKYVHAIGNTPEEWEDTIPQFTWCDDVKVDGNDIVWTWKLSANVFTKKGFMAFAMVAKDENTVAFNTYPAIGTVLTTIPYGSEEISTMYPDIVTQLLRRMDSVEAIATPEAMQNYVNTYLEANPLQLDETLKDDKKAAPANIVGELKEDLVDLPQFKKQNIASEINKSAIGYKNTTNINNNASFADGIYTLTTAADNTVFCGWYFAKKYEIEAGEYFIGFDYETNSGTVELEIRVDGTFKSIGNIKPIVDSETHTYVVKVSCTTGLGIEQIRISGKSKRITVHDIFITKVDNYTKVYSDINKYLKYHNKDFVTPESFGAIGNGIYDDTFAIKEAVAYCIENNVSLHGMHEKVYCVSEQIDITNSKGIIIDFDWATIKAIADIDSILKFDGTGISDNSYNINGIRNIKLDCANRTGGFYCPRAYKTSFIDFAILNVRTFGIKLDAGGGFNASNGAIIGQKTSNECVGIYLNTSDCTFTNVGGIDCHKGIYNAGTNFYYHCHFWLSGNCTGSLYFDHMSGFASLVGCCADTYERSYLSHTDYDIALVNCTFYINPNLYDSDVKPTVFNFRDEVIYYSHHITSNNCSYNIPTNSKNITANLVDRANMKITFSGHNHFNNIDHISYANTSEITLGTNIDADFDTAKYKLMSNGNFAFLDLKLRISATLKNWSNYEIATIDGKLYQIAEKMEFPCFLSTTESSGEQVLARLVIDGNKIIIITPTANMTSLIEKMKFITASAMYPLRDNA